MAVTQLSSHRADNKDTGTTLILLDDATVERLYSQVMGATFDENQGKQG